MKFNRITKLKKLKLLDHHAYFYDSYKTLSLANDKS